MIFTPGRTGSNKTTSDISTNVRRCVSYGEILVPERRSKTKINHFLLNILIPLSGSDLFLFGSLERCLKIFEK